MKTVVWACLCLLTLIGQCYSNSLLSFKKEKEDSKLFLFNNLAGAFSFINFSDSSILSITEVFNRGNTIQTAVIQSIQDQNAQISFDLSFKYNSQRDGRLLLKQKSDSLIIYKRSQLSSPFNLSNPYREITGGRVVQINEDLSILVMEEKNQIRIYEWQNDKYLPKSELISNTFEKVIITHDKTIMLISLTQFQICLKQSSYTCSKIDSPPQASNHSLPSLIKKNSNIYLFYQNISNFMQIEMDLYNPKSSKFEKFQKIDSKGKKLIEVQNYHESFLSLLYEEGVLQFYVWEGDKFFRKIFEEKNRNENQELEVIYDQENERIYVERQKPGEVQVSEFEAFHCFYQKKTVEECLLLNKPIKYTAVSSALYEGLQIRASEEVFLFSNLNDGLLFQETEIIVIKADLSNTEYMFKAVQIIDKNSIQADIETQLEHNLQRDGLRLYEETNNGLRVFIRKSIIDIFDLKNPYREIYGQGNFQISADLSTVVLTTNTSQIMYAWRGNEWKKVYEIQEQSEGVFISQNGTFVISREGQRIVIRERPSKKKFKYSRAIQNVLNFQQQQQESFIIEKQGHFYLLHQSNNSNLLIQKYNKKINQFEYSSSIMLPDIEMISDQIKRVKLYGNYLLGVEFQEMAFYYIWKNDGVFEEISIGFYERDAQHLHHINAIYDEETRDIYFQFRRENSIAVYRYEEYRCKIDPNSTGTKLENSQCQCFPSFYWSNAQNQCVMLPRCNSDFDLKVDPANLGQCICKSQAKWSTATKKCELVEVGQQFEEDYQGMRDKKKVVLVLGFSGALICMITSLLLAKKLAHRNRCTNIQERIPQKSSKLII